MVPQFILAVEYLTRPPPTVVVNCILVIDVTP